MKKLFCLTLTFFALTGCSNQDEKPSVPAANQMPAPSASVTIDPHQVGLAFSDGKIACINYKEGNPTPPQSVLIISGEQGGALSAELGTKLSNCTSRKSKAFKDLQLEGDIYELKIPTQVQVFADIALPATDWSATILDGKTKLKSKNNDGVFVADSCTSSEGLWISLLQENGTTLKPLYSVYQYLGYDTEPTCGQNGYEPLYPKSEIPPINAAPSASTGGKNEPTTVKPIENNASSSGSQTNNKQAPGYPTELDMQVAICAAGIAVLHTATLIKSILY